MVTEVYSADARRNSVPADGSDSGASISRTRKHLATYQILSKPYNLINDYTPYNLPSRVLNKAPGVPEPIDAVVDNGLIYVDKIVENRVESFWRTYDRWVTTPKENLRTGVEVYSSWGKGHVAGSLRRLEEGIFSVGEYLLPANAEATEDDHDHAGMHSYWTSTESVVDSDDERDGATHHHGDNEQNKKEDGELKPTYAAVAASNTVTSKDGKLMPLTPAHAQQPHPSRRRSASSPSLPPFVPGKPERELEGIRNLLYLYARRTYVRNAHKSPSQLLFDALDLARTEAKRATEEFDKKYSMEIGYWHKMMEAGRET